MPHARARPGTIPPAPGPLASRTLGKNQVTYSDSGRNAGDVRQSRSIIFYAWALAGAQLALVAGVIAFVLAGGARQDASLADLHDRAQAAQLANLTMLDGFLSA